MPYQDLYKNIFDTNAPVPGDTSALEEMVHEYPYFSLAHFFLLKHTPSSSANYNAVAAKTALHFNHPFFLQHQLRNAEAVSFEEDEIITEEETGREAETAYEPTVEVPEDAAQVLSTLHMEPADAVNGQEQVITTEDLPVVLPDELPARPYGLSYVAEPEEEYVEMNEAPVEAIFIENDQFVAPAADAENVPEVTEPAAEFYEEVITPDASNVEIPRLNLDLHNNFTNKQGISETNEESVIFEPLFATDYFASQGIKIKEEILPNDKLGNQLRSFTEWLKTMKKVHESKLPAGSEALDLSVQRLAEKSNKEEEVITEAMAEVYLQQGKAHKAKEIYEKLSLLNPSKNAYFAAKIEQIQ